MDYNADMPDDLGPAMRRLNPKQQLFVITMWAKAPISASEAVRIAGYSDNPGTSRVQAHHLMQNENIREAMVEYGKRVMTADGPIAHAKLWEIALSDGHKDQAKVLMALRSLAGFPETVERNTNVNISLSYDEKLAKIKLLAAKTGQSIENLMGDVVDGEFKDVTPAEPVFEFDPEDY